MNYQESREYIDKITREIPSVLGLEHMRELMKRLGNPQDDLKYVHVAGTNGKGSVIAFLYSALSGARYRIGRYVSPTLYSYRGRMEVSGSRISREDFAAYITQVSDVIAAMTKDGYPHPTAFEIETAVAFLFFKKENCDLVLLEVGMGGNLDATNIIKNTLLAVLVSISMDHMSFLGKYSGTDRREESRDHQRRLQSGDCQTEAGSNAGDREDQQRTWYKMYHSRCF